jgi:hypothetical protein
MVQEKEKEAVITQEAQHATVQEAIPPKDVIVEEISENEAEPFSDDPESDDPDEQHEEAGPKNATHKNSRRDVTKRRRFSSPRINWMDDKLHDAATSVFREYINKERCPGLNVISKLKSNHHLLKKIPDTKIKHFIRRKINKE